MTDLLPSSEKVKENDMEFALQKKYNYDQRRSKFQLKYRHKKKKLPNKQIIYIKNKITILQAEF